MGFPFANRALLQSLMASALVVAGATACSRADRTESGSDNTATVTEDTTNSGGQSSAGTSSDMSASDTGSAAGTTAETAATGDTAPARVPSNAPRAATAPSGSDTAAAGYRAMERDTANLPESDSARVTADSSETSQTTVDTNAVETANAALPADTVATATVEDTTAAAGYVAMARDTGATVDQTIDKDSTEILGQVTDSTEILGNVNSNETADEEPVPASEQDSSLEGETVAASESQSDQVGAAAIGGTVTGAEAVALMTREGVRCAVVDPESNEAVRWDMSSTPVSLNPCGLGSMVLSKTWTAVE